MSEVSPRNKLWSRSSATLIVCVADRLAISFPNTSSQGKKPLPTCASMSWDDRSKPTVNYGSLASGRGAGWPEKKTPQHVHRYTARPSLFLLRVSCPDLAWTIDGGKSSCIVSSKVNSERDAQKLGIIGYMTMADIVLWKRLDVLPGCMSA
ncbi:hypothetical protein FOXYSP1_12574 [Fusarium oxysporum f. sp. phaseoli]